MYKKINHFEHLLCIASGAILVFITWQIVVKAGYVSSLLLPSPVGVATALNQMVSTRSFWANLLSTITAWVFGVILGSVSGGIIGFTLGLNQYIWAAVEPWIEFLRALPSVVLVPLLSIFFGVGTNSRLACSTLVVAVLMASSASSAIRSTRVSYLRLAVTWRATLFQTVVSFYLPAALSHMVVALRAAIPLALIVTVAADMLIATDSGIGRILMDSLAVFDTEKLYASTIVVGLLGYISAGISTLIERKAIHWVGN